MSRKPAPMSSQTISHSFCENRVYTPFPERIPVNNYTTRVQWEIIFASPHQTPTQSSRSGEDSLPGLNFDTPPHVPENGVYSLFLIPVKNSIFVNKISEIHNKAPKRSRALGSTELEFEYSNSIYIIRLNTGANSSSVQL